MSSSDFHAARILEILDGLATRITSTSPIRYHADGSRCVDRGCGEARHW